MLTKVYQRNSKSIVITAVLVAVLLTITATPLELMSYGTDYAFLATSSNADTTIKDRIVPKALDQLRDISPTIYDIIIKSGVNPKVDFMGETLNLVSQSGRVLHAYDVGWLARDGSPIDLSVAVFASDDGEEVYVTQVGGTVLNTEVITDAPGTLKKEFCRAVEKTADLANKLGLSYMRNVDKENEVKYAIMFDGYPVIIPQPQGFAYARPAEVGYQLVIDSAGYLRSFSFTNTASIIVKGAASLRVEKASVSKDQVMKELGLDASAEIKEAWIIINSTLRPIYTVDERDKFFVIDASTGKMIVNATISPLGEPVGEGSNERTDTSTNSGNESFVVLAPYVAGAAATVLALALILWILRKH